MVIFRVKAMTEDLKKMLEHLTNNKQENVHLYCTISIFLRPSFRPKGKVKLVFYEHSGFPRISKLERYIEDKRCRCPKKTKHQVKLLECTDSCFKIPLLINTRLKKSLSSQTLFFFTLCKSTIFFLF